MKVSSTIVLVSRQGASHMGCRASQVALVVKNLPTNVGHVRDMGSVPESGRPPGEGHGSQLQYFCLENPMDRGTWLAMVQRVSKS